MGTGLKENLYTPNSIRTSSGIYFDFVNPTVDMIKIEDIAHALSQQCRFGGHLPVFYSVAQHCYNCSEGVGYEKYALEALLHDASEAYLLDIPKPLKNLLPDYQKIEKKIELLIAEKFKLKYPWPSAVKYIDMNMLEMEWDYVFLKKRAGGRNMKAHLSKEAELFFLHEFHSLAR